MRRRSQTAGTEEARTEDARTEDAKDDGSSDAAKRLPVREKTKARKGGKRECRSKANGKTKKKGRG